MNTLVFDLGGVLMKHNMQGCISAFISLMGEDNMHKVLGLLTNGEGVPGSLMDKYEQGVVSTDFFIAEILKHSVHGATADDVRKAWITMHGGIPEERLDFLQTLRTKGYRMYLLSNNNDIHWRDVLAKYPLDGLFDGMFASHIMHLCKPDKRMFEEVFAVIGGNPAETVFIDDLEANRRAAQEAVGWNTCASLDELKELLLCD